MREAASVAAGAVAFAEIAAHLLESRPASVGAFARYVPWLSASETIDHRLSTAPVENPMAAARMGTERERERERE